MELAAKKQQQQQLRLINMSHKVIKAAVFMNLEVNY